MIPLSTSSGAQPRPAEYTLDLAAKSSSSRPAPTIVNGVWQLEDRTRYWLEPEAGVDIAQFERKMEREERRGVAQRPGTAPVWELQFGNFVGNTSIAGTSCRVASGTLTPEVFDSMLGEIMQWSSTLPFVLDAHVGIELTERELNLDDELLHAFAYLRHAFLRDPNQPLGEAIERILLSPHELLTDDTVDVPFDRLTNAGPRELVNIANSPDQLARLPFGSDLTATALASGLYDAYGNTYMPERIRTIRRARTYDTPENRFIKHALNEFTHVVKKADERLRETDVLDPHLLEDAKAIQAQLESAMAHDLWADVAPMRHMPLQSSVLQRAPGYSRVLSAFLDMRRGVELPPDADSWNRILALRDAAELYEVWCFFAVAKELSDIARSHTHIAGRGYIEASEWQVRLIPGGGLAFPGIGKLWYNRSIVPPEREGKLSSWSLTLRPDITLELDDGRRVLLDAKCKTRTPKGYVRSTDLGDPDSDKDSVMMEDRASFAPEDVYKMHTYRDAIDADDVWVLYPGDEWRRWHTEFDARIVTIGVCPAFPHSSDLTTLIRNVIRGHTWPTRTATDDDLHEFARGIDYNSVWSRGNERRAEIRYRQLLDHYITNRKLPDSRVGCRAMMSFAVAKGTLSEDVDLRTLLCQLSAHGRTLDESTL